MPLYQVKIDSFSINSVIALFTIVEKLENRGASFYFLSENFFRPFLSIIVRFFLKNFKNMEESEDHLIDKKIL